MGQGIPLIVQGTPPLGQTCDLVKMHSAGLKSSVLTTRPRMLSRTRMFLDGAIGRAILEDFRRIGAQFLLLKKQPSNPQPPDPKSDALSIAPLRHFIG